MIVIGENEFIIFFYKFYYYKFYKRNRGQEKEKMIK